MSLVDLSGLADHPRIVAAWSHAITLYLLAFPVLVWNRLARPLILAWGVAVWISLRHRQRLGPVLPGDAHGPGGVHRATLKVASTAASM